MWIIVFNQQKLCIQHQIQISRQLLKTHVTTIHQGGFLCIDMASAQNLSDNLKKGASASGIIACQN
jgi:hypothetical protein